MEQLCSRSIVCISTVTIHSTPAPSSGRFPLPFSGPSTCYSCSSRVHLHRYERPTKCALARSHYPLLVSPPHKHVPFRAGSMSLARWFQASTTRPSRPQHCTTWTPVSTCVSIPATLPDARYWPFLKAVHLLRRSTPALRGPAGESEVGRTPQAYQPRRTHSRTQEEEMKNASATAAAAADVDTTQLLDLGTMTVRVYDYSCPSRGQTSARAELHLLFGGVPLMGACAAPPNPPSPQQLQGTAS